MHLGRSGRLHFGQVNDAHRSLGRIQWKTHAAPQKRGWAQASYTAPSENVAGGKHIE